LEDIAAMLDGLAKREGEAAEVKVATQKARTYHRGAEYAYKDAAQILRDTKLGAQEEHPSFKRVLLNVMNTGGNCQAYTAVLKNGWYIVITDVGDPSLPDVKSTAVTVGIYKDQEWEDQVELKVVQLERPGRFRDQAHIKDICEAIAFQRASKYPEAL